MPCLRLVAVLLCVVTVVRASTPGTAADRRPMSVDDMLKTEGFGAAMIDPSGRWLIYERLRTYDQSDDYSFRTYAMGDTGHQLWRYDLKAGRGPIRLPGIDPRPSSYLQGFSPSGHFLAVMQYRRGTLLLGAYDMARGHAVWFQDTPAFSRDGKHNPVWASDHELVYAALPHGQEPELTSLRAFTGKTLSKAWEDAWHGEVVTASEIRSSSKDQSDQQEDGILVRADARMGKTTVLARGLYADLRMSPDHRYLMAFAVSKPRPTNPAKLDDDDLDSRRYRMTLFDLKSGDARPLASQLEFFPYTTTWAPDGMRVAAFGWRSGEGPRDGRFYVINTETGAIARYNHNGLDLASERERGWLQRPERTVFLGNKLGVFARPIPAGQSLAPRFSYQDYRAEGLAKTDWYALASNGESTNLTQGLSGVSSIPVHAGNGHMTVTADDGVYRLYADGRRRRLTAPSAGRFMYLPPGTFATRASVIRPDYSSEALFKISGNDRGDMVMVDLRDGHEGKTVVVDTPPGDIAPMTGSLASGVVVYRAEDGPASRFLVTAADTKHPLREIARINTRLADVDFGTWKVVTYTVSTGKQPPQTLKSCVLLPPGYQPNIPPPLVVEVYPNARPSCEDSGPKLSYPTPDSPYVWAGKGYAYARLSTPGALIRTTDGPIAGMPKVIDAGVDAMVAHGFANPHRVALEGFSQGGVSALYVAAYSTKFRAIIAMNSWGDFFSHYFGAEGVYSYVYGEDFGEFDRYDSVAGSDFGIGQTPFQAPEIYYDNSPVFLAPKINAPVLLVTSDMDGFSMSQFDEMYGALLRSGKDVDYLRYWGEGHSPSSPANIRDLWDRKTTFLVEQGVTPYKPPLESRSVVNH